MFGIYFGDYLRENGILSEEQYTELVKEIKESRLRLGLLAVVNGMMTQAQADEVNMLQQMQDRRFGDIATEKGYLSGEQVESLLKMQGDQYLLCIQILTDHKYLTLEEIQHHLKAYKRDQHFSALDLDAIKSGDLDKIAPVFMKESTIPPVMKDYISLFVRNIVRFIDVDLRLEQVKRINDYTGEFMSVQELEGEFNFFVGVSGEAEAMIHAASVFGKEEFEQVDEDSLDALCEFVNCNNGLYASNLSEDEIELELLPPTMYTSTVRVRTDGPMYKIPIYISGKKLELVICLETRWQID